MACCLSCLASTMHDEALQSDNTANRSTMVLRLEVLCHRGPRVERISKRNLYVCVRCVRDFFGALSTRLDWGNFFLPARAEFFKIGKLRHRCTQHTEGRSGNTSIVSFATKIHHTRMACCLVMGHTGAVVKCTDKQVYCFVSTSEAKYYHVFVPRAKTC